MNFYAVTSLNGPEFESGDYIEITAGLYIGEKGTVVGWAGAGGVYIVEPDDKNYGANFAVIPAMMQLVFDEDEIEDSEDIASHPATPDHGMTSEELADYVSDFIVSCTTRVKGVGDEQYSQGNTQKFESMGLDDLVRWAREEVQDLAVYAAMLDIRLGRVEKALKGHL